MGTPTCSQTSDNKVLRLILSFVIVELYFHVFSVLENLVSIFFVFAICINALFLLVPFSRTKSQLLNLNQTSKLTSSMILGL